MANKLRPRWWFLAGGALVVAAALAWLWWPSPDTPDEPPRSRPYGDLTACLLTDERGTAGAEAAVVWAGMQDASLATRAQVQYLAVAGPQTVENAGTFLASLAQSRCGLVLAAGELPTAAVTAAASRFPQTRFALVNVAGPAANVSSLAGSSADEIRTAVNRAVTTAVRDR